MLACEKESIQEELQIELPPLSEIIYGTWEHRETINLVRYGDQKFRPSGRPYFVSEFYPSDSFITKQTYPDGYIYTFRQGSFEVIDKDSLLFAGVKYEIQAYSQDSLVLHFRNREGLGGWKLFKVD